MRRKTKDSDLTRRDFVTTVGLAGMAVIGGGVTGALAATEQPAAGAMQVHTVPKRKLGKTGAEVSMLCFGGIMTPPTTNCSSSRLGNGASPTGTRPSPMATA